MSEADTITTTEQEPQPSAEVTDSKPEEKPSRSPEDYETEIQRLRKEAAGYRTKLRETEPIVKAHQEQQEANKTELQKAQEALAARDKEFADLQTGYTRLELAAMHNIPPDDIDLIGSGTREEMEARAARLGALHAANAKTPPPPTNRPVEGLRPGASPEPPKPEDDAYPAAWSPNHMRDNVRSQHGQ